MRPNTKLFFAETIGNPKINILDIEPVAEVAHDNDVPLIVDNTIATPYLIRPFEHGADIVVHSATKFLGGHGTVVAGVIVDGGKFQWSKHVDKFPGLTEPDPSYHGACYTTAVGDGIAYIIKARVQLLRDIGAAVSPDTRVRAHPGHRDAVAAHRASRAERAGDRRVAREPRGRRLASTTPASRRAPGTPQRTSTRRRASARSCRSSSRAASTPAARSSRASTLFSHLANIGDVRSARHPPRVDDALAAHPRAAADRRASRPGLVRLSVGLEHVDDLKADLEAGLAAARSLRAAV